MFGAKPARHGFNVLAVIGLLALSAGRAQAGNAWCGSVYGPDGGYVTCDYRDQEQCRMAVSGVGGICYLSPGYPSALPADKLKQSFTRH
jgi:hypothetical protein